ncbi:MAG: hypothetical protein ABGZ23_09525 [Fuerstiella sp.]|nr:hypothetical protein [Fuerstiella sp.]
MALKTDDFIYLQRDVSDTQTDLLPGRVLWTNDNLVAAEMDVVTFPYDTGNKVRILFEDGRRFVAQDAVVEGLIDREAADDPSFEQLSRMDYDQESQPAVVVLERIGQPILAENRECYRVRTSALNVTVEFGNCPECELADISQTGFAVFSDEVLEQSSVVDAALPSGDSVIRGNVRIQSVRQLRNGRYRYGVAVIGRGLQNACGSLAAELQRQVLRRTLTVRSS